MDNTVLASLRAVLSTRSDVALAILFGSFARGQEKPGSDVDLAVIAHEADLLTLAADLGQALCKEVHVVRLQDAGYPLLQAIVRDGMMVHEARRGAAASWRAQALCDLETDRPWWERMQGAQLRRLART